MSFKRNIFMVFLGAAAWLAVAQPGLGAIQPTVFSDLYAPVATVTSAQSQVVYFRSGLPLEPGKAANVYVDQEFHTGLLPGGFTSFCVAPGSHVLTAYLDDAPAYSGKQQKHPFTLEAGKTVFMRVNSDGSGAPHVVARAEAERELAVNRRQVHLVSRASAVQACEYSQPRASRLYSLQNDVLFAFGKSGYADLKPEGQDAIGKIVAQLRAEQVDFKLIEVVGHADLIGSAAANELLGMRRAETVRRVLINGGIPAHLISAISAGSREPVTSGCSGNQARRIACYGPDRRVVLRIDVQQQTP